MLYHHMDFETNLFLMELFGKKEEIRKSDISYWFKRLFCLFHIKKGKDEELRVGWQTTLPPHPVTNIEYVREKKQKVERID